MTKSEIIENKDHLIPVYKELGMDEQAAVLKLHYIEKVENTLHAWAEMRCAAPVTKATRDIQKSKAKKMVEEIEEILPKVKGAVIWNLDPRGYALKLDDVEVTTRNIKHKLQTDFGLNVLLAPSAQCNG